MRDLRFEARFSAPADIPVRPPPGDERYPALNSASLYALNGVLASPDALRRERPRPSNDGQTCVSGREPKLGKADSLAGLLPGCRHHPTQAASFVRENVRRVPFPLPVDDCSSYFIQHDDAFLTVPSLRNFSMRSHIALNTTSCDHSSRALIWMSEMWSQQIGRALTPYVQGTGRASSVKPVWRGR